MLRLPLSVVPVLLAALLLLAGCGGDGKADYERGLGNVGDTVGDALERVPADGEQAIEPAQVKTLAGELRDAADQLDELDPPDDAREAHERFERGLRGVAGALEELARDLDRAEDDEARAERFVEFASDEGVEESFDDLAGAQEAFAQDGYRVFDPPPSPVATTP